MAFSNPPCLMNLVPITIESYSKIDTLMDIDFIEPVNTRRYNTNSKAYNLRGQVNYGKVQESTPSLNGDVEESDGHLVFKAKTLEDDCVELHKGDKITCIAGRQVDFLITEIRPQAHFNGRYNTLHIFFVENRLERGVAVTTK